MKIRPAAQGDYAALARLAGQLGYESSAEEFARRLAQARAANEQDVLVAEETDGQIVGWIGVFVFRPVTGEARVEISGLVVDEKHRSRKIGESLLANAENWARARGFRAIGLHCNVVRERAHGFYQRHGYRAVKAQTVFLKTLGA